VSTQLLLTDFKTSYCSSMKRQLKFFQRSKVIKHCARQYRYFFQKAIETSIQQNIFAKRNVAFLEINTLLCYECTSKNLTVLEIRYALHTDSEHMRTSIIQNKSANN